MSQELLQMVGVLVALGLLPFLLAVSTCFAKLVIVGGLVRQALGTQQLPPNSVLVGLALLLTTHVMAPVAREGYALYAADPRATAPDGPPSARTLAALDAAERALGPFLERHASAANRALFLGMRARFEAGAAPAVAAEAGGLLARWLDLLALKAPAFLVTELSEAFLIGFLILVPFLVIELLVSNVLLAFGMSMLQPQVITLPLKLLVFVLVDGWRLILQGFAAGYL